MTDTNVRAADSATGPPRARGPAQRTRKQGPHLGRHALDAGHSHDGLDRCRYRSRMTERFVTVPGGRLFVVDEGAPTGPPILLLHAGIADLRSWDAMAPILVGAGYRVVRHDTRGFGRTETDDIDYSERADAIAVLDAFEIRRAVLVGNSMGGSNAFDTAVEFPGRVAAVVGVGSGVRGFEVDSTPDEEAAYLEMEAAELAMEQATGAERARHLEVLLALETRFWVDGPGERPDRVPPAIRDALTDMNRSHQAPDRAHGRRIPLQPTAAGRLGELRCPVLVVAGELDVSDVAAAAAFVGRTAPDARVVLLPEVAHMIGMEAPDTLAGLIVDFLAPLARWS